MTNHLIPGVLRFQRGVYPQHRERFERLAEGQAPQTLFITCADSRIDPAFITQTLPGELFVCRNAGNIVPPNGADGRGMTATVEYAVGALAVTDIVVCGHSDCGAMKGALDPDSLREFPHVAQWLSHAAAALRVTQRHDCDSEAARLKTLTRENVRLQLQHLRTHPYVAAGLSQGRLSLHGWVYDIRSGDVAAYTPETGNFVSLGEVYGDAASDTPQRDTA